MFRRWEDRLDFSGPPLSRRALHTEHPALLQTASVDSSLKNASLTILKCATSPLCPVSNRKRAERLRSNEDDEELLIHVPFDGSVKLQAICLIGASRCSVRFCML